MAGSEAVDYIFWGNVLAGCGVVAFLFLLWLQVRGYFKPSPRLMKLIRLALVIILMLPVAARYQYPEELIKAFAVLMLAIGLFMKLRKMMGI